ncbi:MAG: hypothetical protein SV186_01160, partial [Candidatus Nanohaloarchaea archaeon]|nr:hypothetical protein [Candidatus Nanohaloarchaea archaeon]
MELGEEEKERIRRYYQRDEIVEEMVRLAQYREFAPTYPQGYGSRPDSVNFPGDFRSFIDRGAIAFHGSVERWRNPLLIDRTDHDKLRTGWDLVIDIDADDGMEYAKEAANGIVDELERHGLPRDCISVKFSGNRGFHVGVRGECFPERIGGTEIAELYPKLPQAIVGYLRTRLHDRLAEAFREIDPRKEDVISEEGPYEVADIENDWGQRHLFRMPYSVNEKTIGGEHGTLVSLPIALDDIDSFEKPDARMLDVEVEHRFLDEYEEGVAADLAVEALDWLSRQRMQQDEKKATKDGDYDIPDEAMDRDHFPAPIKRILRGLEDGRKRALFILATFLRHVGYDWDAVEKEIWEWNDRNKEPLRDNYVKSQLQWHRRQDEPLMPPNFDAKGWYKDIGVIDEQEDRQMLDNFDNPVPYAGVLRDKAENRDDESG